MTEKTHIDEYAGHGGQYIRDPKTGRRKLAVAPTASAESAASTPPPAPGAAPAPAIDDDTQE